MKVRCINNEGAFLRNFEYDSMKNEGVSGRFGATGYTTYEELTLGAEYLVMGVIIFKTHQGYLVDDGGFISVCPCQLFEVIDDKVNTFWHFRLIDNEEDIYPFIQAIFGYPELCADKMAYENLIVNKEEVTERIYFRRKIELEKEYK
ncbi:MULTISPECIES: hypothetical protein [Mesonia]|uniref:Uncharacterized protein n=1 Tax=Mesonia oceanica TaxID=2687242 RepID=A0AC61Y4Y2_9FLAO|nr:MULTISPECIES: hypothetical protein [Mesonia]MAN26627.1 hypothetical protein [Mesonia sp.]MAQ40895.1 hypothetical protein [Mesonia sp.]MBJ97816.1 hypothetical protein [Flavobacteriaceae bacterium]VVU99526.1 hypothetical protein FVB9532_00780 [Mesonia oceanica]|tara:strand:+ start:2749 stop:3189 length:441 start_codon:yes stop_codon:yes gene_type:complete